MRARVMTARRGGHGRAGAHVRFFGHAIPLSYETLFVHPLPAPKFSFTSRSIVARSSRLRAHMGYITPGGAAMRRAWLADEATGALRADTGPAAAANPMAAMDQMKVQVVNQGVFIGLFYAIQVRRRRKMWQRCVSVYSLLALQRPARAAVPYPSPFSP